MAKKKYITYGKGGRVRRHSSLLVAKILAKLNKDFVDEDLGKKGVRSIKDYRSY